MNQSSLLRHVVSTEYLLLAILIAIFFVSFAKFDWWWLFIIFPIVEVSSFGYLQNNSAGALTYNAGHSLIGPTIVVGWYIIGGPDWALLVGMAWLFNIFVNRALGYGMKHTRGYEHTHLGKIKSRKKATKVTPKARARKA